MVNFFWMLESFTLSCLPCAGMSLYSVQGPLIIYFVCPSFVLLLATAAPGMQEGLNTQMLDRRISKRMSKLPLPHCLSWVAMRGRSLDPPLTYFLLNCIHQCFPDMPTFFPLPEYPRVWVHCFYSPRLSSNFPSSRKPSGYPRQSSPLLQTLRLRRPIPYSVNSPNKETFKLNVMSRILF